MKKNCWDVKKCNRCLTAAGEESCPVCREERLDGVHGGLNGGRACWTISHTLCGGDKQGTFGDKFKNCQDCDFYNLVRAEEGGAFQLSANILPRLR
jgi:hypothetical protein